MSDHIIMIAAAAAFCSTACADIDDYELHDHQCTVQVNATWNGADIDGTIDHSDGRQCPLDVPMAGFVEQGATLYDNTADYPDQGNAISLEIEPFDEYNYQSWTGDWALVSSSTFVWFDWYLDSTKGHVWRGQNVVNFARANSPDHVEHRVWMQDEIYDAKAVIELTYTCGDFCM